MATSSKKSAVKANLLGKRGPQDDFETKPILTKHKEAPEEKETTEGVDDHGIQQRVEFLETKSDQPNSISVEETVEGLDETPDFLEDVAIRNKTLFFGHISPQTTMSDIIKFFKNVEGVVRIQLVVAQTGEHRGCGFVEFASAFEAAEALQNKNGEYINECKILIDGCFFGAAYFPPKFCIDHEVRDQDYILPDNLPMGEDAPRFPLYLDDYRYRSFGSDTLFIANLSPQTKIPDIIALFGRRYDVLSVRLIVNHEGKNVGYGFVEFYYNSAAHHADLNCDGVYLHDHKIFLTQVSSFEFKPQNKYNLAEMLWYEDCLRRETLDINGLPIEDTNDVVEKVSLRSKTVFVGCFSPQTEISHIINFFKDVGEVVYVRLIQNSHGTHVGDGYVEFASTDEANKALEKNGEYLHDRMIFVCVPSTEPPLEHRCCTDYNVWYEDYLPQESLLIKEDEEDETLEELVEEVAERKKTLFLSHLPRRTVISDITSFFKDVAEVFRVRLIVDHKGEHVGCCFVEFASVNDAKKALQKKKNGKIWYRKIDLDVAKMAPYPLRPKYNWAEKIWYEDYLRRESCAVEENDLETEQNLKKQEKVMEIFCGKRIVFSEDEDD